MSNTQKTVNISKYNILVDFNNGDIYLESRTGTAKKQIFKVLKGNELTLHERQEKCLLMVQDIAGEYEKLHYGLSDVVPIAKRKESLMKQS